MEVAEGRRREGAPAGGRGVRPRTLAGSEHGATRAAASGQAERGGHGMGVGAPGSGAVAEWEWGVMGRVWTQVWGIIIEMKKNIRLQPPKAATEPSLQNKMGLLHGSCLLLFSVFIFFLHGIVFPKTFWENNLSSHIVYCSHQGFQLKLKKDSTAKDNINT